MPPRGPVHEHSFGGVIATLFVLALLVAVGRWVIRRVSSDPGQDAPGAGDRRFLRALERTRARLPKAIARRRAG